MPVYQVQKAKEGKRKNDLARPVERPVACKVLKGRGLGETLEWPTADANLGRRSVPAQNPSIRLTKTSSLFQSSLPGLALTISQTRHWDVVVRGLATRSGVPGYFHPPRTRLGARPIRNFHHDHTRVACSGLKRQQERKLLRGYSFH